MKIIILGEPQSQLRPRATRMGNGIRLYDPKKTADYKKYVRDSAALQWKHGQLKGALHVKIDVYRPIQKSTSKKDYELKKSHVIRPTVKADIDNYTKAILDSCNGILWRDDSQVVSLIANKYYSDNPRIEIEVDKIEQKTVSN